MQHSIFDKLGFHQFTSQWFTKKFEQPSPPQLFGWPSIASGKHTLVLAPTGSGKTLTAFLWCIDELIKQAETGAFEEFEKNQRGVHTLYISPLKALNNDIHVNLQEPLQGIRKTASAHHVELAHIRAAVRTGDTPSHVRQKMVKKPPHILITTPESLYLLLTSEKGRDIFPNLRYVIVDEIHAISNNKRGVHLSLSLERLNNLCQSPPVRIGLSATQKPLSRIAAFLGGQDVQDDRGIPRPVEIADCGQRKEIHLAVKAPVPDYTDLPDASVWPGVIKTLYELITTHQNTLVFANMRAKTEKVARQLNELYQKEISDPNAVLALAHHGSISREMRYEIEAKLKSGSIPAVIATSSLELGIDIGSIDLVVHLQTPENVASGLQRVGRSGHLLAAKSKGIIIPLFQNDLDDSVTVSAAMLKGDIEETHIPENCLDVLAQQIVAELSMHSRKRKELLNLVKGSYCYRHITENIFNNVIDMLSGKFADGNMRALQPRITWDRVNDELIARKGARLLAVMSGGTIADRGYYGVYLEGTKTRLGEVEEEFVFESRVGDIFFLGNNEWRINEITRDRIIVTPRSSSKPRPPFWKAEPIFKSMETCMRVGALRRQLIEEQSMNLHEFPAEIDTVVQHSLTQHLRRQTELTEHLPTDKRIVVEYFRDTVGEPHILIHTTFGGRVNGAWATALGSELEKNYGSQVQFTFNDDGILFRLYDENAEPDFSQLFQLSADEIDDLLVQAIANTPLFYVRFRQNAARALLLQRSTVSKRIPLWLQRLRAADLLNTVRDYADFPILIETYRDCLQDVFDLNALKETLDKIQQKKIEITFVTTPYPSPMASGLLFNMVAQHMYDYDRQRIPGFAAEVSNKLLAEILDRSEIPCLITIQICEQAEAFWQHLHPDRQAKDIEDIYEIIDHLSPISTQELLKRSHQPPKEWLTILEKSGRIQQRENLWYTSEYLQSARLLNVKAKVEKYLRWTGPKSLSEISAATDSKEPDLRSILQSLLEEKSIVHGNLVIGQGEQWCDRDNFARLYRKAIADRRKNDEPADRTIFNKFLLHWHGIQRSESMPDIFNRYLGCYFPLHSMEQNMLPARISADADFIDDFKKAVANGDLFAIGDQSKEKARYQIQFIPRGKGSTLFSKKDIEIRLSEMNESCKPVIDFLKENGYSLHRDISEATGKTPRQVDESLSKLVKAGLVSCDDYESLTAILQAEPIAEKQSRGWHEELKPGWSSQRSLQRNTRRSLKQEIPHRLQNRTGRWFLITTFALLGKTIDSQEQAQRQARMLLSRYGIVVKEFYRKEQGLLPWPVIFKILKKMEWSGEIRRGYFIRGLSGIQFTVNEALDVLENMQSHNDHSKLCALLSTIDPALPFGGTLPWGVQFDDKNLKIVKSPANHLFFENHLPAAYLENFAARVFILQSDINFDFLSNAIKNWLRLDASVRPRKNIEILTINEHPAAKSQFADVFQQHGFEMMGDKLILWPSHIG